MTSRATAAVRRIRTSSDCARRTAGQVAGDGGGVGRVAGHQPVQPLGLGRRDLDALQRLSVFHHHPSRGSPLRLPTGMWPPSSATRRWARALRVRVFTVPSGHSSRSAISTCVSPSRYASTITTRSGSGISASAAPTAARMSAASTAASGLGSWSAPPSDHRGRSEPVEIAIGLVAVPPTRERDERWASARRPQPVDGPVAGDRPQPRRERRERRIEQLGAVPERQECLLHDLLGDLTVASQPERDGVDAVDMPVVERREGLLRAVSHRPDKRGVLGLAVPALRHALRALVARGFAGRLGGHGQRQRPALEARAEHDVGLGREHVLAWSGRGARSIRGAPCRGPGS